MSLRSTFRWLTAADERERVAELDKQIASREAKSKSPRQVVVGERDRLRMTIRLRLGAELVVIGVLIAGVAAKLAGVFDAEKKGADGQSALVEGAAAKPLQEIDFDETGMLKKFVLVNLPKDQKDVDALHDKIGEALKLALQDKNIAETYRTSDIDIMLTPDVKGRAQAEVERIGAAGGKGLGVDFRTWSGDAITISTIRRGQGMHHLTMIDEKLLADPLKLAVAMDHELGHVQKRKGAAAMLNVQKEETEVFTESIARMRTLVLRLRATNGPNCPLAKRLEEELIPKEEGLLRGWRDTPKER